MSHFGRKTAPHHNAISAFTADNLQDKLPRSNDKPFQLSSYHLLEQLLSHLVNLFHSLVKLLDGDTKFVSPEQGDHDCNATECTEVLHELHPLLWHPIKVCQLFLGVDKSHEKSNENDVGSDLWKFPLRDPVENQCPAHDEQHPNDGTEKKCLVMAAKSTAALLLRKCLARAL